MAKMISKTPANTPSRQIKPTPPPPPPEESAVINDSEEFVPMQPEELHIDPSQLPPGEAEYGDAGDLAVEADGEEHFDAGEEAPADQVPPEQDPKYAKGGFIPLPAGSTSRRGSMPTPNRVLRLNEDKRLDTVPFEFADIRALAQRILKRAQEQGQAKLASIDKHIADLEKKVYDQAYKEAFPKGEQEGFAKGEKEGAAKAEGKIQEAIKAEKDVLKKSTAPASEVLKKAVQAMNEAKEQLRRQAEGDLLLLAIDLAKRLIGHELTVDKKAIEPIASECIDLITDRADITVRVNPEDYQVMKDYYPELKMQFPDLGPIQVVSDPAIQRGGIMAATREAEVDMRLATRLASFEEVILGYSGQQAIPPWNKIPPEAVKAAAEAAAKEAAGPNPADPPLADAQVQELADEAPPVDNEPSGEAGDAADLSDADLADLAELADMEPPA